MAQLNIALDTEVLKDLFTTNGKDKAFNKLMETILSQVLQPKSKQGSEP